MHILATFIQDCTEEKKLSILQMSLGVMGFGLTECHKANNDFERTLQRVDSTSTHHQQNICTILTDFTVYTPPVVRELIIKGSENALL